MCVRVFGVRRGFGEILPYELHYWTHISRLPVIVAERALLFDGWGFEYVSLQCGCKGLPSANEA